jgi:catechol 2,3-dioxygenase-like lactoylglutathione lyase family enzyme
VSSLRRSPLSAKLAFRGGRTIALKVPPHQFDGTVAFYRDVLGLEHLTTHDQSEAFRFGNCSLWIDLSPRLSQAELWLELQADDTAAATAHLAQHGVTPCDEVERLPEGFDGVWIANPAGLVHLVAHPAEDPGL